MAGTEQRTGGLELYQRCQLALQHFIDEQSGIHSKTMKEASDFLEQLSRSSKSARGMDPYTQLAIEESIEHIAVLLQSDSARKDQNPAPNADLSALEFAIDHIFWRLAPIDVANLLRGLSMHDIVDLGTKCLRTLEHLQECRIENEATIRKTRSDIETQLISETFDKNKKLNKFEEKTYQGVRELIQPRLEVVWEQHCKTVLYLQEVNAAIKREIAGRERQIRVIAASLENAEMPGYKSVGCQTERTQAGATSQEELVFSHPKIDDISIVGAIPQSNKAIDSGLGRPAAYTDLPSRNKPVLKKTDTIKDKCSSPDPTQHHSYQPDVTSTTAATHLDSKTQPPLKGKTNLRIKIANVNHTHANPTESSVLEKPAAGSQSDKGTPCSSTATRYEYEHNKENNTPSPLLSVDKKTWIKVFDGIDKYAYNLFAKSPKSDTS